jgi:hypothetical protein
MNKEFLHMQKLAGLITESQYNKTITILEDETIDESIKNWIVKGLIVLSMLGGVGKVYQMDQAQQQDKKARIEYYNNVLSKEVDKMSDDDLFKLGADIAEKTGDLKSGHDWSKDPEGTFERWVIGYAQDYIKARPNKFAVGVDGGIYQIGK